MFVLEIAGRAIAITDADADQAHELFGSEEFKQDLRSMHGEGGPLWDGSAPFLVRPASADEIDGFEDALSDDDDDENASSANDNVGDEEDGINVLFLVPVESADGTPGPAS